MKFLPFHRVSLLTQRLRDMTTFGDWYAKRLAIAMGMGLMGLRSGSVVQVRRIHLSRAAATLHVPPRKRGLARDLPIPPNLATALWSFLATHESPNVICTTTGRPLCRRTLQRAAVNVIEALLRDQGHPSCPEGPRPPGPQIDPRLRPDAGHDPGRGRHRLARQPLPYHARPH